MAKQKHPWVLLKAHHPKRFEKGVYAVSYRKKGLPLLDRNTKLFQVKAKSRKEAIKKARQRL
jgi:hypothetical protein